MRSVAKRFKVSLSFVYTLLRKVKRSGKIEAKAHGGGHPAAIDERGQAVLKNIIEAQADLTLEEIRDEYNQQFDPVSRSTIDRTLKKLKISRKKSLFDPRRDPPDNQRKLQNYKESLAALQESDLIFVDEMGSPRNITRNYARSKRAQRAKGPHSLTRGTRISTIGALSVEGLITAFCYQGTLTAH